MARFDVLVLCSTRRILNGDDTPDA